MQDCMKGHPEVYAEKTGDPTGNEAPKDGSDESSPIQPKEPSESEKPSEVNEDGVKPAEDNVEPLKTSSEKAVQP